MKAKNRLSKAEEEALEKVIKKYAEKLADNQSLAAHAVIPVFEMGIIAGWAEHDAWIRKRRRKK